MTKLDWAAEEDVIIYFRFLDDLRQSGVTNMMGSGVYVEDMFELDRQQAKSVVTCWMQTYCDDSAEERAVTAMKIWK